MLLFNKSQIFTLLLQLTLFYLVLWAQFAFGEADFYKIKDRETLSRSHNDLNTSDGNVGLTESFSNCNVCGNLKSLFLKFLLI
jgi:hypothetical protein